MKKEMKINEKCQFINHIKTLPTTLGVFMKCIIVNEFIRKYLRIIQLHKNISFNMGNEKAVKYSNLLSKIAKKKGFSQPFYLSNY